MGLRTGATAEEVVAAIEARHVTRSWPMRGTLHLMATEDVRWMCRLLNPRLERSMGPRLAQLELTPAVVDEAREVVLAALADEPVLTRGELFEVLRRADIEPAGQRGIHLLGGFCREGLLCQGPPRGSSATFVVLDEWAPWLADRPEPTREEAMAALAERYVRGHGPVTVADLARWCGQTLTFAREAVALAGDRLRPEESGGPGGGAYLVHVDEPQSAARAGTHLVPGFDELVLGYGDRSALLTREQEARVVPGGNGMFLGTVVSGGAVLGTWGRRATARTVTVRVTPFDAASVTETRRRAVARAAQAYGRHLGLPATLEWAE